MNKAIHNICRIITVLIMLAASPYLVKAEITLSNVQPTDVTPFGFSIVWKASEPGVPLISIFSDAEGTSEITSELEIVDYPLMSGDPTLTEEYYQDESKLTLQAYLSLASLMKIKVHGCSPDTEYYIRVGTDNGNDVMGWFPEAGSTIAVRTSVVNDFVIDAAQLLVTVVNNAGDLNADGWMILASTQETAYPISAVVGDGVSSNQAYLDLSNLFGPDGLNWIPVGSFPITIQVMGSETDIDPQIVTIDFLDSFQVSDVHAVIFNTDGAADSDSDGLPNGLENRSESCTDPLDADSDDDGIMDGQEDVNYNGIVDVDETDPCNSDTDGDGIQDGTEIGITVPVDDPDGDGPATGTDPEQFVPDTDPGTGTNPLNPDSDGDGTDDGVEDSNYNGAVDLWETDPEDDQSRPAAVVNLVRGFNVISIHAAENLKDWLPVLGDTTQIEKVMTYDEQADEFITFIPGDVQNPSVILDGTEGLIVIAHVQRSIGFATALCPDMVLQQGFNIVGLGCEPDGYSAYQLLTDLDTQNITSIQRFNTDTGMFETAGFDDSRQIVGVDFKINAGEGYFIYLK